MKGDFSRFTFDRRKHYAGVRLQQGRVQLDADWNEQGDIAAYQRHTLAADVIGRSGAPEIDGGFELKAAGNTLRVTRGRYYVDGLLCENEAEVPIDGQPDLPGFALPTKDGLYLAYLDVWQRSVTALEDPDLLELALKGADTATRLRTIWQVKLHELTAGHANVSPGWEPDPKPRPTLAVRAVGDVTENQLYRIEVHKPGPLGVATFKWSRDNGSIAALIRNPASTENIRITRQIGPDQGGFETDQWIEVTDETRLLQGRPGILVRLSSVSGQVLAVEGWPGLSDPPPDLPSQPQIRRWDSDADPIVEVPPTNDGYIDLDANLEVRFGGPEGAYFRTGDSWVVPVRAAAGVLWPADGSGAPLAVPPHGVQHHYAPLYVLQLSGGNWTVTMPPYRKVFQGRAGEEKLNRTENDRMTASLEITGNLKVEKEVTVGRDDAAGGKLVLRRAPLVLATGGSSERGLVFPSLDGASAFLRYDNPGGAPRLTLGVGSGAALALRQGEVDQITLTGGRVGIRTPNPQQDVHITGDVILLQPGNGVTVEKALTYRDGSQSAGRVLTSDAEGRATWKSIGPVFLRLHVGGGRNQGIPVDDPWTPYSLPGDKVPSGVRAVILEAHASKSAPDRDRGMITDAFLYIRRGPGDPEEYILLRARAAGYEDFIALSNQGVFPVQNNSFEYKIATSGFEDWTIHVVGYFP